jgi:ribonuclease Z
VDLQAIFLGTGGSVPSARRSTASVLIARGGERLMFDCGEGTQRQLQRSLGLIQVDAIYLTHFHADHVLGLPGLLKSYDLTDREPPLTIYGPRGLQDLFSALRRVFGKLTYPLELVDSFATITFIEDCLRDDDTIIACGPEDLPAGYAGRRN